MRLRIEYFDQNDNFERLLPRACTVERTIPALDSSLTWYLLKLDASLRYEDTVIDRFMVASRWWGNSVGGPKPTSVHILIVPEGTEVGNSFSTAQFGHVAWGLAHAIGE